MAERVPPPPPATAKAPGDFARAAKKNKVPGAKKIRAKELPTFTRQLAAMLSSGLPVVQALVALEEQVVHKQFKVVIAGLRTRIEGGAALSEALTAYPDVFDDLYVSIMRAGETGGLLAETTNRIANYLESSARLQRKVVSAMMYPAIVSLVALALTTSMIVWIVPVFASIYDDFGAKLPGPTQFLVNLSNALRNNALVAIAIVVGIAVGFTHWKKSRSGALVWDRLRLKFPVFGPLMLKVSMSRFASTFAQLTRSGVPILQGLEIVAFAVGNKVLSQTILKARDIVERGENLSSALVKDKAFPPMMIHMLSAGEKTGRVDDMLDKVSEFYDNEVEAMLSGLTSLIEPLLMVFLGVVIGGVVLCMFMPIFKMHEIVAF